jgi:hypothetical protein
MHHDCLLVLDTLGTRSTAAILGITALRFDLDDGSEPIKELGLAIGADSNRSAQRTYDAHTLAWWTERPDMHEVFTRQGGALYGALCALTDFYGETTNLWTAKGFESNVLASAYEHFDLDPPWPFWSTSCAKTLKHAAAWLDGEQMEPSEYGDTARDTAYLRVAALRRAYFSLQKRAIENVRAAD